MNLKNRNPVTCLLLSIITCGIYGIYWAFCIARDAVSVKDPGDSALLEIILVLFLPFIGFYLTEKKFAEGCAAKGIAHKDNSTLYLVLGFIGLAIINYFMMQSDLNRIADAE